MEVVLRGLLVLLLGAGCGRLSFGAQADRDGGGNGDGDGSGDVDAYVGCGLRTPPDPLTVSGQTYRYTSFDNDRTAMSGVTARLVELATGSVVDEVTSAATGDYSLAVSTAGLPARVMLELELTSFYTTRAVPEVALDADVVGMNSPLWALGDAPMWNANAMNMVHASVGATLDPTRSTINIAVRDCAGNAVEGVTVSADPAPGLLSYQGADGRPDDTLTATIAPFAHALLLNAPAGPTRITGTKGGVTFIELMLDVPAGPYNTLSILRAVE